MSDNNPQTSGVTNETHNGNILNAGEAAGVLAHAASNGGPAASASTPTAPPSGVETPLVSGRYEGRKVQGVAGVEVSLELRVDVDGKAPVGRISGDFFQRSGGLTNEGGGVLRHWGSFTVPSPKVEKTADQVTIKGKPLYGPNKRAHNVRVTIPLAPQAGPRATATFANDDGSESETFECAFASPFFRTVEYEVDLVEGTEVFDAYDAGPPEGPQRLLTVDTTYAKAGVEMVRAGVTNVVFDRGAARPSGPDGKWSDSELYASMLDQFSLVDLAAQTDLTREKQWRLWLLVATEHEQKGMRGMMFNSFQGRQRQGCAVFYNEIAGDTAEKKRAALRTYVHEMGHCFNLLHPWEKSPPPERADSLSFMNYVEKYPDGEKAYWDRFTFEFDPEEVLHLRHTFRDNIIMGGNFFGTHDGGAELSPHVFNRPLADKSGLRLKLEARKTFVLCEPVVVELKLQRDGVPYKRVHQGIHPDRGFVRLAIRKPGGRVVSYRPLAARCVKPEFDTLTDEKPSVYASAYVGYGRDGFYFDQAGFYQLVAVYQSPCGSEVVSDPITIRVRNPLNEVEEEIADLYYGDAQGALFYLLGSDSERLSSGNRCLENVLDKYRRHPLAVYALLAKGVNAGRHFKRVTAGKRLAARAPRTDDSRELLSNILDSAIRGAGMFRRFWDAARRAPRPADGGTRLDNITLNMCARRLARAQKRAGDKKGAAATLDAVYDYFKRKGLKGHVLARIREQKKDTLEE